MSIDQWMALAILATLFALEGVIPFYDQAAGCWSHAARNIGLALTAGLVGAVMAPGSASESDISRVRVGRRRCNS